MIITYNQKPISINSISELMEYINNNSRSSIKFIAIKHGYYSIVDQFVKSNIVIKHKELLEYYKNLINCTSDRVTQVEFYLDRGYTKEEAIRLVSECQSNRSKKGIANNPDLFKKRIIPSNIAYWTNKGYSIEESKSKVKEHQTTFSLEKCILKYGHNIGIQRFLERQSKWQSNMDYSTFSTTITWEMYLSKYGNFNTAFSKWIELAISKRQKNLTNNYFIDEIINNTFNSKDDVLLYLMSTPFHKIQDLNASILRAIDLNVNEFYEKWFKHNNIIDNGEVAKLAGIYGNRYYYNGYMFESSFELKVGLALINLGLEFNCHKQYPNSKRKYDFYIPSLDIYIEAMGICQTNHIQINARN